MVDPAPESLAAHLRAMSIDNFAISGSTVRIGRTHWSASVCRCGGAKCDGWSFEPLLAASLAAVQRQQHGGDSAR